MQQASIPDLQHDLDVHHYSSSALSFAGALSLSPPFASEPDGLPHQSKFPESRPLFMCACIPPVLCLSSKKGRWYEALTVAISEVE